MSSVPGGISSRAGMESPVWVAYIDSLCLSPPGRKSFTAMQDAGEDKSEEIRPDAGCRRGIRVRGQAARGEFGCGFRKFDPHPAFELKSHLLSRIPHSSPAPCIGAKSRIHLAPRPYRSPPSANDR